MTRPSRPRKRSSSGAEADPDARRPVNPGGPPTEQDRADALSLLGPLVGLSPPDRLAEDRPHDHTAPTYDPNRVVRVLTALAESLPDQIRWWKHSQVSRASVEKTWTRHLEGNGCADCPRVCDTCGDWARELRYDRADDDGRRIWRPRRDTSTRPRSAAPRGPNPKRGHTGKGTSG